MTAIPISFIANSYTSLPFLLSMLLRITAIDGYYSSSSSLDRSSAVLRSPAQQRSNNQLVFRRRTPITSECNLSSRCKSISVASHFALTPRMSIAVLISADVLYIHRINHSAHTNNKKVRKRRILAST